MNSRIEKWSKTPIGELAKNFDDEFIHWNGSEQFEDDVSMVIFEYTDT